MLAAAGLQVLEAGKSEKKENKKESFINSINSNFFRLAIDPKFLLYYNKTIKKLISIGMSHKKFYFELLNKSD